MQSGGVALNGLVIELETGSYIRRGCHNIPNEGMWQRKFNAIGSQNREFQGLPGRAKACILSKMMEEMNTRIKYITPTILYDIQVCCHLVPEMEERTISKTLEPHELCQVVRDHLPIR